ncbi:MAG: zinc-ribbon domain-containing protein [Methanobrevibacter sp.]|nr:zinc-ribbon domain-containing protein [Candidatus Methanovirga meridionalis]
MANLSWKQINSLWIIFVFIPFINALAFIYVGLKAKKKLWIEVGVGIFILEWLVPALAAWVWFGGIIYAFIISKKFLDIIGDENFNNSKAEMNDPIETNATRSSPEHINVADPVDNTPKNKKYCSKCGAVVSSNTIFCGKCGFKIKEDILEPEPMKTDSSKNIHSLKIHESEIRELEVSYKIKEKNARELIEKHFAPPQLTYYRFIGVIDDSNQIFYNNVESTLNIINLATGHTPKVDGEINKRLDRLKSIIEKIDELTNEMAINLSNSNESYSDEIKDLLEDMEELVDSVKEYS